ncbi:hypothetical protein VPNG_03808 [Cytospora leucostoma]|uniref:Uncharacterized protein n=1 Tax=Cytospora leucostoma TaxID=1230097 RepID=A0A423XFB6_9PEZI|nr:hypothetical protein VPNG_03808 [Cytospora leucostoma]
MGNTLSILTNKTFVGWAVISAGIAWVVYTQYDNKKTQQRKLTSNKQRGHELRDNQPKKENKAKRQRLESFASEPKQTQPKSYAAATATPVKAKDHNSDDAIDNREFAKQMIQNKQSKLAPKVNTEQKQKSVKQSKAKEINPAAGPGKISAPSSTAGIDADDADDDQSSVASPVVSAADPAGVSDMLEQTSQGPSVLRLTGTAEKQQKSKQAKSPQRTETKKQRQNRLKAERAKADREEDEKVRKALLETQRRTAREAEGRAAKDGSTFIAAQKPSPWTGTGANGNAGQKTAPVTVQPLDTFDDKTETATSVAPAKGKENSKQNGHGPGWTDIPFSEEEQLEMIKKQAEETEWVPVAPKSRKTKTKNANVVSETDESAGEAPASITDKSVPKAEPTKTNGRPKAQALPSQSSFAHLSDEGADLGDEQQEQEWDV